MLPRRVAGLVPQPRPSDSEVAVRLVHLPASYPRHLQTDLISEALQAGGGNITQAHLVTGTGNPACGAHVPPRGQVCQFRLKQATAAVWRTVGHWGQGAGQRTLWKIWRAASIGRDVRVLLPFLLCVCVSLWFWRCKLNNQTEETNPSTNEWNRKTDLGMSSPCSQVHKNLLGSNF